MASRGPMPSRWRPAAHLAWGQATAAGFRRPLPAAGCMRAGGRRGAVVRPDMRGRRGPRGHAAPAGPSGPHARPRRRRRFGRGPKRCSRSRTIRQRAAARPRGRADQNIVQGGADRGGARRSANGIAGRRKAALYAACRSIYEAAGRGRARNGCAAVWPRAAAGARGGGGRGGAPRDPRPLSAAPGLPPPGLPGAARRARAPSPPSDSRPARLFSRQVTAARRRRHCVIGQDAQFTNG